MKLIKIFIHGILIFSTWILLSCNKESFLAKKPNTSLIIPESLDDCQELLSYYNIMNGTGNFGEASSDDYTLQDYQSWQSLTIPYRNLYIWNKEIYEGTDKILPWNNLYQQIIYSNIVLEAIARIHANPGNQTQWNTVKGSAHFFRAFAYYNLAQTFCMPYDKATADKDLGLPIKLNADVNELKQRSDLQKTYDQITSDLAIAKDLLPETVQTGFRNRPCKPAALALLSRMYLMMRNYDEALAFADSSLLLYDVLMDFNEVTEFNRTMPEVTFQSEAGMGDLLFAFYYFAPYTVVDSSLYHSYPENDLRKERFFKMYNGYPKRNMSYAGTIQGFSGFATDELYLIKAECLARKNQTAAALQLLNQLLEKRYITGTFVPLISVDAQETLGFVLAERRKELCFRGLRWQDIRRLNKEGANIILARELNGKTYTLPPNSPRYALPIPPDEIRLSGLEQNPRD